MFDITVFSISIDIEMSAGAMDQQQVIMLVADEETMQGMEDSIECQHDVLKKSTMDVGKHIEGRNEYQIADL